MATRTVRLDDEAEAALREVQRATGLPISAALKKGLHALREQMRQGARRRPYDVYRQLDLREGGYAIGPASESKRLVRQALRKKLHR